LTPIEFLLAKLPDAKKAGNGWAARCPAHEDNKASLSVAEGDDGTALLRCHAGCTTSAILSTIGMTLGDLFPAKAVSTPKRNGKPRAAGPTFPTANAAVVDLERRHGKRSESWTYHDAQGEPVGVVVRWNGPGGKDIRPVSRHGSGWRISAMPDPRPLYRLPDLERAERVIVTEGEKAADAARSIGFTATTSAGGSQAAEKTDWSPLSGKHVVILPDHDAPGERYADDVARLCVGAGAASVRIVRLAEHAPTLPIGGDLADVLADETWCGLSLGCSAEPADLARLVQRLADETEPYQATEDDAGIQLVYHPFPVAALPRAIQRFVVIGATAIGCDPSYVALPLLVALAATIGNARQLQLKPGWLVPCVLWAVIIGESGTLKSPALRAVLRSIFRQQQKALAEHAEKMRQYEADLAEWDKAMALWKKNKSASNAPPARPPAPEATRLVAADVTIEALATLLLANPRGMLVVRDELAAWFGGFDRYAAKRSSADCAAWLSMYNADPVLVDRKTGDKRTIYVPRAAVSIVGGVQPGTLRRALGVEHRENGLAARLLLTNPPRVPKEWRETGIDARAESELEVLFSRLRELKPDIGDDEHIRPVTIGLTSEAKGVWVAFYATHARELAETTGDLASALSKLEEVAARLALVLHFVRWAASDPTLVSANEIDAQSMTAGVELARWFTHEARRVYQMLDETDADRDQRLFVEWIAAVKGGAVTARDVQSGYRKLRAPGAAEEALNKLIMAKRGAWESVPTTPRGGRPSRVFHLSAASSSTKPSKTPRN
jgi:hypothetical protein